MSEDADPARAASTPPAGNAAPAAPPPEKEQARAPAPPAPMSFRRKVMLSALGFVAIVAAGYFGIPWLWLVWSTVSTDDAYVNGHVTFVAPRVSGQVVDVRVDDNNRVKEGDLLVLLDETPFKIQVRLKAAYVAQAKADLVATTDQVRGQVALARSNRFKLEHTIENVNNQIALLQANVAALSAAKARQVRAQSDYDRAKDLAKTPGAISAQDLDLKLQDIRVAESQTKQALEMVYQTRVGLGLPAQPELADDPDLPRLAAAAVGLAAIGQTPFQAMCAFVPASSNNLSSVPANLDQTFSTVRQAVADLLQSAAPLGIFPSSYDLTPRQTLAEFYKRDPQGNLDRIIAHILEEAPAIKQAEAKLQEAEQDLAQAKLNLSYCRVVAEIDGVVTRRNVNRGNNLQAGQNVMAIRSLTEIWIDANFKETQLSDLRIGQPVKLDVDMYGSRRTYEGRITGFTMGTGQTLALLPPQNATGNFVKIVQRLPVRVDLINYNPDRDPPLFVGLSVEPYVYVRRPLVGDDPGKGNVLQPFMLTTPARKGSTP